MRAVEPFREPPGPYPLSFFKDIARSYETIVQKGGLFDYDAQANITALYGSYLARLLNMAAREGHSDSGLYANLSRLCNPAIFGQVNDGSSILPVDIYAPRELQVMNEALQSQYPGARLLMTESTIAAQRSSESQIPLVVSHTSTGPIRSNEVLMPVVLYGQLSDFNFQSADQMGMLFWAAELLGSFNTPVDIQVVYLDNTGIAAKGHPIEYAQHYKGRRYEEPIVAVMNRRKEYFREDTQFRELSITVGGVSTKKMIWEQVNFFREKHHPEVYDECSYGNVMHWMLAVSAQNLLNKSAEFQSSITTAYGNTKSHALLNYLHFPIQALAAHGTMIRDVWDVVGQT